MRPVGYTCIALSYRTASTASNTWHRTPNASDSPIHFAHLLAKMKYNQKFRAPRSGVTGVGVVDRPGDTIQGESLMKL